MNLVELQEMPIVDCHESGKERQQLVRGQKDGRLLLPGSGTAIDVDLSPARGREADRAIQCGILEFERDAATLPAGSSLHQAPQRFGPQHVDQLRRQRSPERRLDRSRRGRRAVAFRTRGDQGVGHPEQVRLPAAVLTDDDVHAAAEAESASGKTVRLPTLSLLSIHSSGVATAWARTRLVASSISDELMSRSIACFAEGARSCGAGLAATVNHMCAITRSRTRRSGSPTAARALGSRTRFRLYISRLELSGTRDSLACTCPSARRRWSAESSPAATRSRPPA